MAENRNSALVMDELRRKQIAYEYLCRLEEAKIWIESVLREKLPETVDLELSLTNGVYLAKIGNYISPKDVPLKKIYDFDLSRYYDKGLHFRHTDNIIAFISGLKSIGFPKVFYPETTDIYDSKNLPKVIYCIHALSLYLFRLGKAPMIDDLCGKVEFSDADIHKMSSNLEVYGVQMPVFSKIGGILAGELSLDDAALHAAILSINSAIDENNGKLLQEKLLNVKACLVNIKDNNYDIYLENLKNAKNAKIERASKKKKNEVDVYDKMLTQAEIQGHLNFVNVNCSMSQLANAVVNNKYDQVSEILLDKAVDFKRPYVNKIETYSQILKNHLLTQKKDNTQYAFNLGDVNQLINDVNAQLDEESRRLKLVSSISTFLKEGKYDEAIKELDRFGFKTDSILKPILNYLLIQLNKNTICMKDLENVYSRAVLIKNINNSVDVNNEINLIKEIKDPLLSLQLVEDELVARYLQTLKQLKSEKISISLNDCFLNGGDISSSVNKVNTVHKEEHELLVAVKDINEAIKKNDLSSFLEAIKSPQAKLSNVIDSCGSTYLIIMNNELEKKILKNDDKKETLWIGEIQASISLTNKLVNDSNKLVACLQKLNEGFESSRLSDNDLMDLVSVANINGLASDSLELFKNKCKEQFDSKQNNVWNGWNEHKIYHDTGYFLLYHNVKTKKAQWLNKPEDMKTESCHLSKEELQVLVRSVAAQVNKDKYIQANLSDVIRIQSLVKGFLYYHSFKEVYDYYVSHEADIIKIQSIIKSSVCKSSYSKRIKFLNDSSVDSANINRFLLAAYQRHNYLKGIKFVHAYHDEIVTIQSYLRYNFACKMYRSVQTAQPKIESLFRFTHLLDIEPSDIREEIELQVAKEIVANKIRDVNNMNNILKETDTKIGLIVKNKINMQELIYHHKKLGKNKKKDMSLNTSAKEKTAMIEKYEQLFYLLQIHPTYLAKVITQVQISKSSRFLEQAIYNIYNYATNLREDWLLCKLLSEAVINEILYKMDSVSEWSKSNTFVVRMIVNHFRDFKGSNWLVQPLRNLIQNIVVDKTLNINFSPVEIYKAWINQTETDTGVASTLPYDVDTDKALTYPEVKKRIDDVVEQLKKSCDTFMDTFLTIPKIMPYGLKYMAFSLKKALKEKFTSISENECYKVVGNLIYYRVINPAIVAPDGFEILDQSFEKGLSAIQRRNLGSIAKVLQNAAAGKLFASNDFLSIINSYVEDCWKRFREIFTEVCRVESLDDHFHMDDFTEFTTLNKPTITMTADEITGIHQILVDNMDILVKGQDDLLYKIINKIGDVPKSHELVTSPSHKAQDPQDTSKSGDVLSYDLSKLGSTEIHLQLNSFFEFNENSRDMKKVFHLSKKLLVDLIRQFPGMNIKQIFDSNITPGKEVNHSSINLNLKDLIKATLQNINNKEASTEQFFSSFATDMTLEQTRAALKQNLNELEANGMVTSENDYQDLIDALARDMRNQRGIRARRRLDVLQLHRTNKTLDERSKYYDEQISYYNQYIKACLEKLCTPKNKKKKGRVLKYSADKLRSEGVILEIEGLTHSQFKLVQFELAQSEEIGHFLVSATFMGVSMDQDELNLADLLQLQYDGRAVIKMFDRAKINVNLLISLINRKFYSK